MAEIADLNTNDANNTTRWPPGIMTTNQIDDAGRALEGIVARWYKDSDGSNTTLGSATAYTVTLNRQGVTAWAQVGHMRVRAHVANSGAATIQANALAALPLRKRGNTALVTGDILQNQILSLTYNPALNVVELEGL